MPAKKYYYVYQITNKINKMIYIGYHTTNRLNDNYLGSGVEIKKAIKEFGKDNFERIILESFDNKDDMKDYEARIVNDEFRKRSDTYNKALGGGGLGSLHSGNIGRIVVKDKSGNMFYVDSNDPRYLSGELVGNQRGTVTVKDVNGKTLQVNINDPRYLNGELKHVNKDILILLDNTGNRVRIDSSRLTEYLNNGYRQLTDRIYKKNCPTCNSEMKFTSKHKMQRSIKNKSNCRSCSNRGVNNPQYKHGKRTNEYK